MSKKGSQRLPSLKAQRLVAGQTITGLAKASTTSDLIIQRLENGGNCEGYEAQRIADALGVSLATLGKVDL